MGLLTFGLNVTLDGCYDHREMIADDELAASRTSNPHSGSDSRPYGNLVNTDSFRALTIRIAKSCIGSSGFRTACCQKGM